MNRGGLALAVATIIVLASIGTYYLSAVSSMPNSTASSSPSSSGTTSAGTGSDWTTYHHDNARTGNAGTLSISSAKAGWVSQKLDGEVYAEPLAFDRRVIVATENDSVYALDARGGTVLWRTHIGAPVPGPVLPCGNIDPSGITGTPVIDPDTGIIYVVAFVAPGNHSLVALSASDGRIIFTHPADPSGADPKVEQQRAALSLGNGLAYWFFGGLLGDCGQYHGWVVGLKADGTGTMVSYRVPTGRAGGIWAPSGAVVYPSGDLFVAIGNSGSTAAFDFGNSVIELSPSLQEIGYFAPPNWAQLNQGDTDLGSMGPAVVGDGLLFQIGKEGVGYLLNASKLGGVGGQVFSAEVCSSAFGGTATSGKSVFVPCTDGLVAVAVSGSSFTVAWRGPSFPAGPPIVTGNVVWAIDTSTGTLDGFDAATGKPLLSLSTGAVTRFTTPMFAYGELFVAAGDAVYSFVIG